VSFLPQIVLIFHPAPLKVEVVFISAVVLPVILALLVSPPPPLLSTEVCVSQKFEVKFELVVISLPAKPPFVPVEVTNPVE
jgi:hypothetical protein